MIFSKNFSSQFNLFYLPMKDDPIITFYIETTM